MLGSQHSLVQYMRSVDSGRYAVRQFKCTGPNLVLASMFSRFPLPLVSLLILSLPILAVLTLGCSVHETAPPSSSSSSLPAASGPLQIDVFSARGFLGGSEYERYYLTGSLLWRECGSVSPAPTTASKKAPLEGDQVLSSDPQLHIQERRVEKLTRAQAQSLRNQALSVLSSVDPNTKHSEPPPGSVFSLADPGLFEMLVAVGDKKERIISSVDAVADKKSATLKQAHELFAKLRGIGPEICGASTFYGIEREAL